MVPADGLLMAVLSEWVQRWMHKNQLSKLNSIQGWKELLSAPLEAFSLTALSLFRINICFAIAVNTNTFESSFSAYCLFWS